MQSRGYFANISQQYAAGRPTYPSAMFEFLCNKSPGLDRAWDCATGSGQAASQLTGRMRYVVATDISINQLDCLPDQQSMSALACSAETSPFRSESFDLVTVGQALHWFHLDAFFEEANRVLKPGGLLAVWCYGACTTSPAVDALYWQLYDRQLGEYWPPGRELVDQSYGTIAFPYQRIETPVFAMEQHWSAQQYMAYLASWSAVDRYKQSHGKDPLPDFENALLSVWEEGVTQKITWPIVMLAGFKPG